MTTERDPRTRIVLSWLREEMHENAEGVLRRALDEVDTTPQRRFWWPAWRDFRMNKLAMTAWAAAAVLVVAVVRYNLLPGLGNVGPGATPSPSPSATETTENGQPVVLSHTSPDGEVTVSAPSTWTAWLPGKAGRPDGEASDVWFGMLSRASDPWPNHSSDHIGFVDPVAYDSWCATHGGSPLLSAPADAAAIAQQVIADPNFETTAPVAAHVGGLDAVSIDVALAPDGRPCGIQTIGISRWIHTLVPGFRLRLYLVDLPDGMSVETLAIHVLAPEDLFEEVLAETAPIIESIEFHPRVGTTSPPDVP